MGPRRGATTAKGAMVINRVKVTRPRAALVEILKNNDPARATVTMASAPRDNIWVTWSRLKGDATNASAP
jgi:hypothetical protein